MIALDINMGQKILVRLRPPYDPDTFLPEESIVGTMLHEVCMHTFRSSQKINHLSPKKNN